MAENEIRITQSRFGSRRQGLHTITAIPPQVTHENPLVIIPGYLANSNPRVFENVARGFAELGRETTVVTFTGWHSGRRLTESAQMRPLPQAVTEQPHAKLQVNQADMLLTYLDQEAIKPDVVAHSLGTQPGLIAISMAPNQFGDTFLGVTPTGVNKEYPIDNLDVRFATHIVPEINRNLRDKKSRKATRRHLVAGGILVATHPVRTLFYERGTIKNTNLVEVFRTLDQDEAAPNANSRR